MPMLLNPQAEVAYREEWLVRLRAGLGWQHLFYRHLFLINMMMIHPLLRLGDTEKVYREFISDKPMIMKVVKIPRLGLGNLTNNATHRTAEGAEMHQGIEPKGGDSDTSKIHNAWLLDIADDVQGSA